MSNAELLKRVETKLKELVSMAMVGGGRCSLIVPSLLAPRNNDTLRLGEYTFKVESCFVRPTGTQVILIMVRAPLNELYRAYGAQPCASNNYLQRKR